MHHPETNTTTNSSVSGKPDWPVRAILTAAIAKEIASTVTSRNRPLSQVSPWAKPSVPTVPPT